MRRQDSQRLVVRRMAVALVVLLAVGCGGRTHLADYQFSNRTLALVYVDPPSPQLLHGYGDLGVAQTAMQTVMRTGGVAAKEVVARRATARLDSAAQRTDVPGRLAQRTLERASRYLGTRPVSTPDGADFLLEITMKSYGIDARSSTRVTSVGCALSPRSTALITKRSASALAPITTVRQPASK